MDLFPYENATKLTTFYHPSGVYVMMPLPRTSKVMVLIGYWGSTLEKMSASNIMLANERMNLMQVDLKL